MMRAVKAAMAISTLKYRGVSHSTSDLDTEYLYPIHITPNPKWPLHRSRMVRRYHSDQCMMVKIPSGYYNSEDAI